MVKPAQQTAAVSPVNTTARGEISPTAPASSIASAPEAPAQTKAELTEYAYANDRFQTIFIDQNAAIKETVFKRYKDYVFPLVNGLALNGYSSFGRENNVTKTIRYTYTDSQKRITKDFSYSRSDYELKLIISVENLSGQPLKMTLPVSLGTLNLAQGQSATNYQDVCVSLPDKLVYPNIRKDSSYSDVNFLSLRDRYFCAIIEPLGKNYSASIKKNNNNAEMVLQSPEFDIPVGNILTQEFRVFIGPQDLRVLSAVNPDWKGVVYFGKMDFLAQILLNSLVFFHGLVRNWGFSIIIVSIIVYVILFPLTLKQFRSMKEMQLIQPKVEALRCKYKDDPMRMQRETMEIYKEHKINPLGGCLPMILQIPVFFSFYMVLSRSIELKGANFLWIRDLSEPDKLVVFQQNLPFLGNELNLLPLLMIAASFFQQKMSMASSGMTGQQAQQQKIMMYVFPLMFGVFFYHMPSGLVLYWFTNTVLSVVQQTMIMKSK
ncbi:MAG: membrane protein insertase YidC [Deltaproteobacteria bacterium]